MPLYDYRCPDGHLFEALADCSKDTLPCKKCCKTAERVFISVSGCKGTRNPHLHTGRKFWTGVEVYGEKKIRSGELAHEDEQAMKERAARSRRGRRAGTF